MAIRQRRQTSVPLTVIDCWGTFFMLHIYLGAIWELLEKKWKIGLLCGVSRELQVKLGSLVEALEYIVQGLQRDGCK